MQPKGTVAVRGEKQVRQCKWYLNELGNCFNNAVRHKRANHLFWSYIDWSLARGPEIVAEFARRTG